MRRSRFGLVSGIRVEAAERVAEVRQCLVVGPATLRFFRGQYRVIDRLLGVVAAAEVKCQQFGDFFSAARDTALRAHGPTAP